MSAMPDWQTEHYFSESLCGQRLAGILYKMEVQEPTKDFPIQLHWLVFSLICGLVSNFKTIFQPRPDPKSEHSNSCPDSLPVGWIWTFRNPFDLCFGKSSANSGYLWVRLHVRACLAIFTNCWRPHSVSRSRPERQHPWEKERESD